MILCFFFSVGFLSSTRIKIKSTTNTYVHSVSFFIQLHLGGTIIEKAVLQQFWHKDKIVFLSILHQKIFAFINYRWREREPPWQKWCWARVGWCAGCISHIVAFFFAFLTFVFCAFLTFSFLYFSNFSVYTLFQLFIMFWLLSQGGARLCGNSCGGNCWSTHWYVTEILKCVKQNIVLLFFQDDN